MEGFSEKERCFSGTRVALPCRSTQILLPGSDNSELSMCLAPGMSSGKKGEEGGKDKCKQTECAACPQFSDSKMKNLDLKVTFGRPEFWL